MQAARDRKIHNAMRFLLGTSVKGTMPHAALVIQIAWIYFAEVQAKRANPFSMYAVKEFVSSNPLATHRAETARDGIKSARPGSPGAAASPSQRHAAAARRSEVEALLARIEKRVAEMPSKELAA